MFCTNCGTEFDGKFCPKCGHAAVSSESIQHSDENIDNHRYYDKDGELIDLSVVYGVYKKRALIQRFFKHATNYNRAKVNQIIDYMFENVKPKSYGMFEAGRMQKQIESSFKFSQKSTTPLQRVACGFISVIAIIFLAVFIFSPFVISGSYPGFSSFDTKSKTYVTKDEFNSIESGMTYSTVVDTFGGVQGELLSEVDIGRPEYRTQVYCWYGSGHFGANCNVTFQGGRVISKAQIGLE